MQHLRVNFGGIWRFELGFFILFFLFFLLKKSWLIFKCPVATLHCRPPEAYAMCSVRITCNATILYIRLKFLIRDHVMHPNTSVNSVNEQY